MLRSGRHTKLLEMIYHLMLIGSQGSSRMETAFVPRGEDADIQMCIKLFHEKCCSLTMSGKQEGKKQTPLLLIESQPKSQHAPVSTYVIFYQPQEGILPIVPPRAYGFLDPSPNWSKNLLHSCMSSALLYLFLLTLMYYQEKLYSHMGKEDKCLQPFCDTTALLSFHENDTIPWFSG